MTKWIKAEFGEKIIQSYTTNTGTRIKLIKKTEEDESSFYIVESDYYRYVFKNQDDANNCFISLTKSILSYLNK